MISDIPPSHYEYQIPDQDRSGVENYLRFLLYNDHFAFVLFGSKAIAMTAYNEREDSSTIIFCPFDPYDRDSYNYEYFYKYKDLFCSDNVFIKIDNNYGKYHRIICVNSKKFLEVVDEYKDRFSKVLGPHFSGEKLLNQIKNSNEDIMDILGHSDELFGILLGFGQKNSYAHTQRCIRENSFSQWSRPPFKLTYHCPFGSDPYERYFFLKEKNKVKTYWPWLYVKENRINLIANIRFCGFDEEETREIAIKFDKARKLIATYYKDKNLIDASLKQIHRKNPITIE